MFRLLFVILLSMGITYGCTQGVEWIPKAEDRDMEVMVENNSPRVRIVHNIKGVSNIDVIIGKAQFMDVREGETTSYEITEKYDVAILVSFNAVRYKRTQEPLQCVGILSSEKPQPFDPRDEKYVKMKERTWYTLTLKSVDKVRKIVLVDFKEEAALTPEEEKAQENQMRTTEKIVDTPAKTEATKPNPNAKPTTNKPATNVKTAPKTPVNQPKKR